MRKGALVSVSNREGLIEFCKVLVDSGYEILATTGSRKYLADANIPTLSIEEYTGQREILDGRVKTLHPKIHAGILAKRSNSAHMAELDKEGIIPIDVAIVNLYPFVEGLNSSKKSDPGAMVELVDIGGPTMIRAAAKNFLSVIPVIDPSNYGDVCKYIKKGCPVDRDGVSLRARLASKVFATMASYDLEIARYTSQLSVGDNVKLVLEEQPLPPVTGIVVNRAQELRYGENPHQLAGLYRDQSRCSFMWKQLSGKELSYNNLLDLEAAIRLVRDLVPVGPATCIIKHLNPCGAACGSTLLEALQRSKRGDPRSHFGGIVAFTEEVTREVAQEVREDFAEIVVAPKFSADGLEVLKQSKNLRIIEVPIGEISTASRLELRSLEVGVLIQEQDRGVSSVTEAKLVSNRSPSQEELADLQFAWRVCSHVKSNAIVIAKDGMLLAVGAGQMSRIDSVELALNKAELHQHNVKGAVCASDAFFPFPDSIERLGQAGVAAVIAPAGAKRDEESIAAANKVGTSLLFAGDRHFRH